MKYTANWMDLSATVRKYVHVWAPEAGAQASVCIVHGLGEHGGRYDRLAREFVKSNVAVVAFDQTGHGVCSRRQGCIESYDCLLDDIELVLQWARRRFDLPPVLFGHSMGGNLVLNYAFKKQGGASAVISSSPMILAAQPPSWLFERIARMALLVAPNLRLKSRVNPARLMSDPDEQQLLTNDALFHSRLSLRLAAALLDTGRGLLDSAPQLAMPTLLTHGTDDCRTSPSASSEFARRAGQACVLEIYEGQLHDTFRDIERQKVIARFVEFIQQHSYRAAS